MICKAVSYLAYRFSAIFFLHLQILDLADFALQKKIHINFRVTRFLYFVCATFFALFSHRSCADIVGKQFTVRFFYAVQNSLLVF